MLKGVRSFSFSLPFRSLIYPVSHLGSNLWLNIENDLFFESLDVAEKKIAFIHRRVATSFWSMAI